MRGFIAGVCVGMLFELCFAGVLFELWVMRVAICCVYLILFARPVECGIIIIVEN